MGQGREGWRPGARAATRSFTLSLAKCSYSLSKTKYPFQSGRAGQGRGTGHSTENRAQRPKGRGQRAVGSKQHSQDLQALRVIRATCTAATWPGRGRPVACDVDNTKLLVK